MQQGRSQIKVGEIHTAKRTSTPTRIAFAGGNGDWRGKALTKRIRKVGLKVSETRGLTKAAAPARSPEKE
jgi:hypothetical protein